jgi:5-methylcytosine-specific restriction endonuclease McrA
MDIGISRDSAVIESDAPPEPALSKENLPPTRDDIDSLRRSWQFTGITSPNNETQRDHIIPKAKGGYGSPENGQVLCRTCNLKKSDK